MIFSLPSICGDSDKYKYGEKKGKKKVGKEKNNKKNLRVNSRLVELIFAFALFLHNLFHSLMVGPVCKILGIASYRQYTIFSYSTIEFI